LPDFYSAARFLRSRGNEWNVGDSHEDAFKEHEHNVLHGEAQMVGGSNSTATLAQHNRVMGASGTSNSQIIHTDLVGSTETVPKSAVVMYCIKVTYEYVNPNQVDISAVAQEIASKVACGEVRRFAGTQLWRSDIDVPEINTMPVANTVLAIKHGLDIDPLQCQYDVLVVCVVANNGYSVGDVLGSCYFSVKSGSTWEFITISPRLDSSEIMMNTLLEIKSVAKTAYAPIVLNMSQWKYVFRIWH